MKLGNTNVTSSCRHRDVIGDFSVPLARQKLTAYFPVYFFYVTYATGIFLVKEIPAFCTLNGVILSIFDCVVHN